MKIQCDVCEKAPATVMCCADEAALCAKCDIEVHAANKLASKHQRLRLESVSTKQPKCDVCQDKTAYIFCIEDRALLCRDCDEPIHSAGCLSANHQRFLAAGIRVGLSSDCRVDRQKTSVGPPNKKIQQKPPKMDEHQASSFVSPWPVDLDDVLQFSDFELSDKKESFEFGELDWLADMGLLGEQIAREGVTVAEVPQLTASQSSFAISNRPRTGSPPNKKPRIAIEEDDHEHFTVPDLG